MARRRSRRLAALLTLSALAATSCQGDGLDPTTTVIEATSTSSSTTTTSIIITTTTTTPTTTTASTFPPAPGGAQVMVPEGEGPFPAIVLVHGGGWVIGDPSTMAPLAGYLTGEGFLTVNTPYQLSLASPGFPGAVQDVSCAVAYAASHPDSDGSVTLIGHSAGAHISAIVALNAAPYDDECDVPDSGSPDRLIGLAGPYDVNRIGSLMVPFFGVEQVTDPELWDSGNPHRLVELRPGIEVLLIHGGADPVVPPDFTEDFGDDLVAAGAIVTVEVLEGVDHPGARSPAFVGELIVEWLGG